MDDGLLLARLIAAAKALDNIPCTSGRLVVEPAGLLLDVHAEERHTRRVYSLRHLVPWEDVIYATVDLLPVHVERVRAQVLAALRGG